MTTTLEEFCQQWNSGEIPMWQQVRWLAGAGIPAMAGKRPQLLRDARKRLGLPSGATEAMIVYEELRQRNKAGIRREYGERVAVFGAA